MVDLIDDVLLVRGALGYPLDDLDANWLAQHTEEIQDRYGRVRVLMRNDLGIRD